MSVNAIDYLQCEWICPITQLPIKEPVITQDGHTYEKSAIIQWLSHSSKSPQTGLYLDSKKLIPNRAIKAVIGKFSEFINQVEKIYKSDFGRLQQLIEKLVKHDQKILEIAKNMKERLHSHNKIQPQSHLHFQLEKSINSIIEELLLSKNSFVQKYQSQKIIQSPFQIHFSKTDVAPQFYKEQDTLRHPFEYLVDTFKSQKQIKARYQTNDFTQLTSLEHQRVPVDILKFLQFDWKQLKMINLMECGLIDIDWQHFVNNGSKFPNLREIKICKWQIRQMKIRSEKFKKGTWISSNHLRVFCFTVIFDDKIAYGGWTNPLSEQSKAYLRSFKQLHPEIHILFQE